MPIREIRILIADDHPQFLKALRQILSAEPELRIVAECSDGLQAFAKFTEVHPDIAVLDIEMPGMDGIEVATRLEAAARIILLTMHKDEDLVVRAREAGARGYVLKENAALEVIPAIRAVASGSLFAGRSCSEFQNGGR
jgi:DNA-binding NarL/FixJ family response regulator